MLFGLLLLSACFTPYWRDPRIHTWGNVGVRGMVHAMLAPASTWIIDQLAYDGVNLRERVLREYVPAGARADLCCGTGFSTASGGVGVDTSEEMLRVARLVHRNHTFCYGNAETWGAADAYDVCTCMFGMHEMPRRARRRVLRNMLRLAPKAVVVDISPDYSPSWMMLTGEPYLLEYQMHIDEDVSRASRCTERHSLVDSHAILWVLERDTFSTVCSKA